MPRTKQVIRWVVFPLLALHSEAQNPPLLPDPYQWLEDVNGARSMAWVKAENERSSGVLKSDPRFATFQATALKILETPERLAFPSIRGNDIYNNWQDAAHPRGVLRRTSLADYLSAQPHWQTLIDFEALGKQDNEKWVSGGRSCLYPGDELCMIRLSAGGEDAVSMREFNLKTREFVPGGFSLPHSKQTITWLDKDTLLLARDWGAGTMTKSGYPFVLKQWKRGQPIEQATEVFRGKDSDIEVEAIGAHDADGNQATLIVRALNFSKRRLIC